jgi:hypothetical protein
MSDFNNKELAQFHSDYVIASLPCVSEVARHLLETRTFDTNSLFAGDPIVCPEGGYGTQLWLEKGVRMQVLSEMTFRVALNKDWMEKWNAIFDSAFNAAQYGEQV